jgi:HK97 family phage portal protein
MIESLNSLIKSSGQASLLSAEQRNAVVPSRGEWPITQGDQLIELGTKSWSGKNVTESTALSISAVYRCVNLLAGSFSMLPGQVIRFSGDDEQIDRNHYLHPLLNDSFDENWSAVRAKRFIVEQLLLRGNAIIKYQTTPGGRVTKLTPIHFDRVTFLPQSNGSLRYLVLEADGVTREYTSNSILHIRNLECDDFGIGISTIGAARNTMGLALASEEASSKLFANGMIVPGYLSIPGKLDAKQRKNFEESLEKQYQGVRNAYKLPLLEGGITYQRTGISPADAEFLNTRKLSLQEIAILFGIHPAQLGLISQSGASAEQAAIEYLVYTLQPLMSNIEGEIRHTLLSTAEQKTISIEFDVEPLLRTDSVSRFSNYQKAVSSGVMKPSEARKKERLPHDPDGDTLIVNGAQVRLRDVGVQWTGNKNAPDMTTTEQDTNTDAQ